MTRLSKAWLVSYVFTFAFVLATPLAAQQGPPTLGVEVTNTSDNPVPVVVTGGRVEEFVFFRSGYQVPTGKRLFVDDVSITCSAVGALPAAPTFSGVADFERFGISATTLLRISYSVADCPETPSGSPVPNCPSQDHVVGTAQTNGTYATSLSSEGRPATSIGAGRQITAFADQGATLVGICVGLGLNFPNAASLRGTGRLIDRPN